MIPVSQAGEENRDFRLGGGEGSHALALVRRLADAFRGEGVDFCHWKSNEAIALSEAGINDLDLLVSEGHVDRAREILDEVGFLEAEVPRGRRVPGMTDYFGLDGATGRLVQVQLHETLVLGDDMTKNYRLPVEGPFLASSSITGVLPVPAPEFEYVVFVLRMAIKHCPLDCVLMGKGRLTRTERSELGYLENRLDRGRLEEVVGTEFPSLADGALEALRPGLDPSASILTRARVGRQVTRLLRPFRRRSQLADLVIRIGRRLVRRLTPRPATGAGSGYKSPASGGAVIAFIGGDGAGKSTAVTAVFEKFSSQFRVMRIHMGKPPRSLTSRVVRKVVRALGLDEARGPSTAGSDPSEQATGPGVPLVNVMLARDRRRQARQARSLADSGCLVLSDRYPAPELKSMDAPRNGWIAERNPGPYFRLMARIERVFYRSLPEPDVRLVFRVTPEVAASRRPEQSGEFVMARAREVTNADWAGSVVLAADADAPSVHSEAVTAVWGYLTRNPRR
jgi:thymidylate kinase